MSLPKIFPISIAVVGSALIYNGHVSANDDKKIEICHRNQGRPEWVLIEISENALQAHLKHQWGEDIYPVPEGGCPTTVTPTTEEQPSPTTSPITTVPITSTPTNPTTPAASPSSLPPVTTTTVPALVTETTISTSNPSVIVAAPREAAPPGSPGQQQLPATGYGTLGIFLASLLTTAFGVGMMILGKKRKSVEEIS